MDFFILRHFITWVLLCLSQSLFGQLIDTISKSFEYAPKVLVKLDTRNSFVATRAVKVRGVKVGANYNDISKIGLGYHWAQSKFERRISITLDAGEQIINGKLRLEYIAPFYEYTFYKRKKLEVSIPVQLGFGRSFYRYKIENKKYNYYNGAVILYEPAMSVLYKPIPWLGLGLGVGYRLMLLRNKKVEENFTSPIYLLKFNLFVGYFYNKYLKKKESNEDEGNSFDPNLAPNK